MQNRNNNTMLHNTTTRTNELPSTVDTSIGDNRSSKYILTIFVSNSYVYADHGYTSSSEDEVTQVLVPRSVRRRRGSAKTVANRRPLRMPRGDQRNNNCSSGRHVNSYTSQFDGGYGDRHNDSHGEGFSDSYPDRFNDRYVDRTNKTYQYLLSKDYDDQSNHSKVRQYDDTDQVSYNNTSALPPSRRHYVEARRRAAKLLGQKKRLARERQPNDPNMPANVNAAERSGNASSMREDFPLAMSRSTRNRSSGNNAPIVDLMPTPLEKRKNATAHTPQTTQAASSVQVDTASDGVTSDDRYSSSDNPQPTSFDREEPAWKPAASGCSHSPVEKLRAAANLMTPTACDAAARFWNEDRRPRQIDLLYIGGLFTLSLLLLYMFLCRVSKTQTRSVWGLLWQEVNALLCIT